MKSKMTNPRWREVASHNAHFVLQKHNKSGVGVARKLLSWNKNELLYLSTQNELRVTCPGSKLGRTKFTNFQAKLQHKVSTPRDQVVLLEIGANLSAFRSKANNFLALFLYFCVKVLIDFIGCQSR